MINPLYTIINLWNDLVLWFRMYRFRHVRKHGEEVRQRIREENIKYENSLLRYGYSIEDYFYTLYQRSWTLQLVVTRLVRILPMVRFGQPGFRQHYPCPSVQNALDLWHYEYGRYHKGNVFKP